MRLEPQHEHKSSGVWGCTPVIPALENSPKFKITLDYIISLRPAWVYEIYLKKGEVEKRIEKRKEKRL